MGPNSENERLSQITTAWEEVRDACGRQGAVDKGAQVAVMNRYHRAVYRYLLGALRDAEAAEELFQEFALRFLRGGLRGADPQRGRFRDYLKGVLGHLITDHYRGRRPAPRPLPEDVPDRAPEPWAGAEADRQFLEAWRDELLAQAWAALEAVEAETDRPLYTVLRHRSEHPGLRAAELAEFLAGRLSRPVTEHAARMWLCRARERFADLLVGEVARSLARPTPEEVAEELSDLGLLDYCGPALERHGRRS
jgi:RNA polymerase sigma-70 factor (ECF subfamily)